MAGLIDLGNAGDQIARRTTLTDRESRLLHAVERSLVHWMHEVAGRNHAGRDEAQRDLCVKARDQFDELRSMILDG